MSRSILKPTLSLPPQLVENEDDGNMEEKTAYGPAANELKGAQRKLNGRENGGPPIDRVCSEPIATHEKEVANMRIRKASDVFDLDLVKRREQKVKASMYMMEQKGRDRVRKAFLNVFLFPLNLQWWRRRVPSSRDYLLRLSALYLLHSISVTRELFWRPSDTPVEFVELILPFLLLVVLSALMGQAAAVAVAPARSSENTPQANLSAAKEEQPPAPALSTETTPSNAFRTKPRKIRRKFSKGDSNATLNTDSNNEMFNDEEDDQRTASSAESDSSDSSSDSSSSDSKDRHHHRPHVVVRRSSLLGVAPSSTTNAAGAIPHRLSQEFTTVGSRSSPMHSQSHGVEAPTRQISSSTPVRTGTPTASPTNGSGAGRVSNGGRKSRFSWSRLVKHNTEPAPMVKELFDSPGEEADSATDEDDEGDARNGIEDEDADKKTTSMLSTDNEEHNRSMTSTRARLFSHSMEDLLDAVKSVHWSVHGPEKVFLTPGQIRVELERKVFEVKMSDSYRQFALIGAVIVSLLPLTFRAWFFGTAFYCKIVSLPLATSVVDLPSQCASLSSEVTDRTLTYDATLLFSRVVGTSIFDVCGVLTSALANFILSWILLGHVAGAVETFKRRHLYAKYFTKLTSSRKARRAGLPYFRLHKVDHIKVWLSLRSRRADLDRETVGPYRASDTVTHYLFMVAIFLVGVVAFRAVQHLSNGGKGNAGGMVPSTLGDWLLVAWAFVLAIYVQRIMALASKTHEKFQNTSVLLTEELNIHMRLLRKPEKKDELNACNQMLKVASALIKELEGNKSKKGQGGALVLDPWLYSIVRVVLLSALGALSSDLFGFRVRLWKI